MLVEGGKRLKQKNQKDNERERLSFIFVTVCMINFDLLYLPQMIFFEKTPPIIHLRANNYRRRRVCERDQGK